MVFLPFGSGQHLTVFSLPPTSVEFPRHKIKGALTRQLCRQSPQLATDFQQVVEEALENLFENVIPIENLYDFDMFFDRLRLWHWSSAIKIWAGLEGLMYNVNQFVKCLWTSSVSPRPLFPSSCVSLFRSWDSETTTSDRIRCCPCWRTTPQVVLVLTRWSPHWNCVMKIDEMFFVTNATWPSLWRFNSSWQWPSEVDKPKVSDPDERRKVQQFVHVYSHSLGPQFDQIFDRSPWNASAAVQIHPMTTKHQTWSISKNTTCKIDTLSP